MRWSPILLLALGCPKEPVEAVAPIEVDPLATELPLDPEVRSGVLDNGLHWWIESNTEPENRAVFRLAVDVGSVLEDDDQRGLAHFVEHMAFNGTTNFPDNELITYLESVGTQFGPHLNAHTSFDETVYKLTVPTDDAEVFDTAFQVLEDWSHGIAFDDEQIEKERGVVLEEWRTRNLGAGGRINEQTIPAMFAGSPYVDRLPIGTEDSLTTFEPDALRRFYTDWYRPERMAVIVVGDFDLDAVQAKIEQHFGGITADGEARERAVFDIPTPDQTEYLVIADPEVPNANVTVLGKHDAIKGTTHRTYRDGLLEGLVFGMLNERLGELAHQPEPPFLGAGAGEQRLAPREGVSVVGASAFDDRILDAYEALLVELRRAQLHGFRDGELERARARTLQGYGSMQRERDTTHSRTHADEIVRVFTTGESMPGIDYESELAERYVPQISKAEVDMWVATWLPDRGRVVQVIMPEREGLAEPTAAELKAIADDVATRDIAPPPEEQAVGDLLASIPEPGTIESTHTEYVDGLGFTGWTLSNGVEVWFKDTDFKVDEVRFRAYSLGGHRLVGDEDYVAVVTAPGIMGASGFGQLDATELRRWFAGRKLSLNHNISGYTESMSASASPDDLEALLQLTHASMTVPRFDEDGFAQAHNQRSERLKNRLSDPNAHFSDAYDKMVWPDDLRSQSWTVETLEQMDLERSEALFRERFGADRWSYTFVGALPDDFEDLVLRYLGSLPAHGGQPEMWVDTGVRRASGQLSATVRKGVDAKARVQLDYHGELGENTWVTRNRLFALGDILSVRLREELREDLGGVYGVSVNAKEWYRPYSGYAFTISFGCDPERVDELIAAARAVIEELRTAGPSDALVAQEQAKNREQREDSLRSNSFWLNAFTNSVKRGDDPNELLTWDARNDSLATAELQALAEVWLDDDDTVRMVLLPEASD